MKLYKVHFITLLELFICISLIVLIGAFFAQTSFQSVSQAKIRSSKALLALHLKRCHDLALIYQSDWTMILRREKGGIECEMRGERPRKKEWIPKLFLTDEDKNEIRITFSSTGKMIPDSVDIFDGSKRETFSLETKKQPDQ
jgi:hypothetical protein